MSLTVEDLRERYLELVSRDETHFFRLLNEAESRLQETAKWNWCKTEATIPVEDGHVYLDPSVYAALMGIILDDGARVIRPREIEFSAGGYGRSRAGECGQGHLVDCGIVTTYPDADTRLRRRKYKVADLVREDTTSTITIAETGAPLNITSNDKVAKLFIGSVQQVNGVYGKVGSVLPVIGISQITGNGTLTVGPIAPTVDCLLHLAHTVLVHPGDYTLCPSARAIKLAMLAVGYEEVNDADRAKVYWADAYSALNEQESTQRGGVRGSATIQPFGDGVYPVRSLM
jgi:hypothetical protein